MHRTSMSPRLIAFMRLLLLLLVAGLDSRTVSAQYRVTQWNADSGLPQNSVRSIMQGPDGYLWITTLNGLARFDGVRFVVFDKSNTPGITSSRFVAAVPATEGDLFLLAEDRNLMRMHAGVFTTLGEKDGVHPHSVDGVTADASGQVWILSGGKIFHWSASKQRYDPDTSFATDLNFNVLRWGGSGFWALRGQELVCFNRGKLSTFAMPDHVKPDQISGVVMAYGGEAWMGTKDGRMARLGSSSMSSISEPNSFTLHGPGQADWKIDVVPPRFERRLHLPINHVDHPVAINLISGDNEGNVWIGTESEGLYRIQRQSINTLSAEDGLASNNTYPVLLSRTGEVWAGSWPGGLSEIRGGKVVRTYGKADGLSGLISSLAEDRDGVLWIGTHDGLRTLIHGHIARPRQFTEVQGLTQAMHQTPDGTMLFGTASGLWMTMGSGARLLTTAEGLATNDVRAIITDHSGDQWIGGYGGLTRIHQGQFTRWTEKEGLPSNNIRTVFEDSLGSIWVGTYDGGIGWLRNGKWVTFDKTRGLFDNGAFQILEDGKRRFWISSNRGIYRVDRDQLNVVAEGGQPKVLSVGYGRSDGMLSAECNGGSWPAGVKDAQGKLWFPTQMGLAIVDPEKMRVVSEPPNVVIESSSVDHQEQSGSGTAILKPGQNYLDINYTALSLTKPEQIIFRYKIDGIDHDWQRAGYRRTAYYTQLPPGDYTFRVQALNSDSIQSTQDAVMRVLVVPPFYRRWWFLSLAAVLIILTISSAWQYRVHQLTRAQERQQVFSRQLIASQEAERRRIAAELHDSLGQRLIIINNLALFLLRAKGRVRTEEEKRQTIEEINGEATAAIDETRAISYALRPFQLDRLGLTRAIQALCVTVGKASELAITTDLENIDDVFAEELRINVYRIVQEGLNNIVKHSGASEAAVTIRRGSDEVMLRIHDNGQGMPIRPRVPEPGQGGFGMTGMRERVTSLNGTLQVQSVAGTGTQLTIQFPISKTAPS